MEKKPKMEEEFNNFMMKVTEIENIIKDLSSTDKDTAARAKVLADNLLKENTPEGRPSSMHVRHDRTVINKKAFERMGPDGGDPAEMSKETFMAELERDAEARAKDRRERKEKADALRTRANKAFRRNDYDGALVLYDEAIELVKDSCVLYENRALTCLQLHLYTRVIDDCNWALRINENSLKSILYKARAFYGLADHVGAENCIKEALKKHEKHKDFILRYQKSWNDKNSRTVTEPKNSTHSQKTAIN